MLPIYAPEITKIEDHYFCICKGCGSDLTFSTKGGALSALQRKTCRNCKIDYRVVREKEKDKALGIYQNEEGKWCSRCSGCQIEQAYTRKDHARNSSAANWLCKKCATFANKIRPSRQDGFKVADYDAFERSSVGRGLFWELEFNDLVVLWDNQKGKCALSGLPLVKVPRTWSIDRIDNDKGYLKNNVQLVDKRLNMMRGALDVTSFIDLCKAIAKHHEEDE